jgi:hypothetical protein
MSPVSTTPVATPAATAHSLALHQVFGISSMVRDLTLFTDRPRELEREILATSGALSPSYFAGVDVVPETEREARAGDVALFRVATPGAYPDMETLWGGRVPLEVGREYVGVVCERGSTKLITAELPGGTRLRPGADLQFIAQAGGIGWATGFSPALEREHGVGVPSDVEVVGALYDRRTGSPLSTLDTTAGVGPTALEAGPLPPTVLVLGTGTDVGKTTAACALIRELCRTRTCLAVKASGTGWYEDSLLHARSGAFPVLNFTFAGLPTTYYVPEREYVAAMHRLFALAAQPERIPDWMVPPERRGQARRRADVIVVEHGGDLIWADIPAYLRDPLLMDGVRAVLVASESALALIGALDELDRLGVRNSERRKLYALVPLVNPEGFYRRVEGLLASRRLAGVVDVAKPALAGGKARRCGYSRHYDDILSCADLAYAVETHTWNPDPTPV